MRLLEERIRKDGIVVSQDVLRVDSFLNHRMDIALFQSIGQEFKRIFDDERITQILTIEASGIGIACVAAQYFNVPVVFAKKNKSSNLPPDVYTSHVHSFTHGIDCAVYVSQKYIGKDDRVLIIDDFLANGCAVEGLSEIVKAAGAELVGVGIVIEKAFQHGGEELRNKGMRVESLARIVSMSPTEGIVFA